MMMAKKNSDYWNKRFANLENEQYKNGADHYKEIENLFRKTNSDIEMEISKWYMRIEDNNEISLNKAKQLLKKDELKEFQWNVKDYIKFGKENAINLQWMKELENASAKVHISRLEAIKLQLQQHIEMLFSKYNSSTNDFLNKSFKNQYYHTAFEIAKGTGIGTNLNKIDLNNINTVLSRPWSRDGSNFSDRIWTNKQKLINNLNTELTQNIIRGSDPKQAIDSLAKQMLVSKNQAATLVMTESAAISSKAQQQCFKDLDVERYEIVSTLDTHTSNICRDLDGKVFDMKDYAVGSTAPPFHPNCRTVTVPYFEDFGGERAARDKNDKEVFVASNIKYDEWYKEYIKKGKAHKINIDLQFFAINEEKVVKKMLVDGVLDSSKYEIAKHRFEVFNNGIETPIGQVRNNNNKLVHIARRHPELINSDKIQNIIDTLLKPEGIYKVSDKNGVEAMGFIRTFDDDILLSIVDNDKMNLTTSYRITKSKANRIKEGETLWEKE